MAEQSAKYLSDERVRELIAAMGENLLDSMDTSGCPTGPCDVCGSETDVRKDFWYYPDPDIDTGVEPLGRNCGVVCFRVCPEHDGATVMEIPRIAESVSDALDAHCGHTGMTREQMWALYRCDDLPEYQE